MYRYRYHGRNPDSGSGRRWLCIARLACLLLPVLALLVLVSCNEKTQYTRPQVPVPASHRGNPENNPALIDTSDPNASLGNLFWWELLQDEVLKELVTKALVQNYDVRIASERILEAQARAGITRAAQYPEVAGAADYEAGRNSRVGPNPISADRSANTHSFSMSLQAIFELDFWGRLRKTTEAARYDLLATEEARNVVLMTLVSEVASSYFTLRALDLELDISRKTLASREESLRLVKAREAGHLGTMLEVDQAQALVYNAQKAITATEQLIAQQENYLSYLIGENPHDIQRGKPLADQIREPVVPAGLPSAILENRPDIRVAEERLIAVGIRVDVAKTAYFPRIFLTGAAGTISKELSNLFSGPSLTWNFSPQVSFPIYEAGGIKNQIKVAESQQRQAVLIYQQTVQGAFREVSDALIEYSKLHEFRLKQEQLLATLQDQSRLANLRYTGGITSYLEVLDTERQLFQAEIELTRVHNHELLSIIKLYKALGGGWRQPPPGPSPSPSPQTSPAPTPTQKLVPSSTPNQ